MLLKKDLVPEEAFVTKVARAQAVKKVLKGAQTLNIIFHWMLPPFTAFNSSQIHMCFYAYIDQESYKTSPTFIFN